MTSPPSGSDTGATSAAFERLHPRIQRWVWEQQWTELRDIQERAAEPVLAGDRDVVISAATASGKTEAAFLSICSVLLRDREAREHALGPGDRTGALPAGGVQVLYVSPLKALINDQFGRLDAMCEALDIPVHRWHGDVAGSRKSKVVREPDGILLITPESLEALLITHGTHVSRIFAGLRYVVIDELHAFLGSERGAQLQSLLNRVELAVRRRVPRIGLSATLGDMAAAAEHLRPGGGQQVTILVSTDGSQELRLQLRGYEKTDPSLAKPHAEATDADGETVPADDADTPTDSLTIADDLFSLLRGTDNLVFANSRRQVEEYTDLLARRCAAARVPNEFVPHHGSLSKDLREDAEARLKDRSLPVTAICTSTLELGIDIGSVTSIAQVGAPHTVASLRQRLGRSGRRGDPAILRLFISEEAVSPQTPPPDALRAQLVQSVAMVELLLQRWNEAPDSGGLHLSTLIQQLLSLIAQHGGVTPREAYTALCSHGPFSGVSTDMFAALLRALAGEPGKYNDMLMQASDGLLLLGTAGERLVGHYSFYAAFRSPQEYRLVAHGRQLGMLPIDYPVLIGSLIIFGGRRWKVVDVDDRAKLIELERSSGGKPPTFTGDGGAQVADRVRQEMLALYCRDDVPAYLDAPAVRLLGQGRANFAAYGLADNRLLRSGSDTLLFGWMGDRIMGTLAVALTSAGGDVSNEGLCLTVTGMAPADVVEMLDELAAQGPPDPMELAAIVPTKVAEKHDELLPEPLLNAGYASRSLDVPGAWDLIDDLLAAHS